MSSLGGSTELPKPPLDPPRGWCLSLVVCTHSAHQARHSLKHAHGGVDIDAINYVTKYTTKMKSKFSHCDQIKFIELVLKPGTPDENSSISLTKLMSSSWKTSCYLSKIIPKSNCKYVLAGGVVHVQKECHIHKWFTYWGDDWKRCNRHCRSITLNLITQGGKRGLVVGCWTCNLEVPGSNPPPYH